MASGPSDPATQWLVRVCPSCRGKCRVKASGKASLCPRCGTRLEPTPPPRARRRADDEDGDGIPYGVVVAAEVPPPPIPLPEPVPREQVEEEERPEPPRWPLLQGIYVFPWHLHNLRPWVMFGLGFTFTAVLGAAVWHLIILHQSSSEAGQSVWFRVLILFIKGLIACFLWTGLFVASFFLATIQETAAGNEEVERPDDTLGERLLHLLYLLWIGFCALAPPAFVTIGLGRLLQIPGLGWVTVPAVLLVFPLFLMSALTNSSWMLLLNGQLLLAFFSRPLIVLTLYTVSVVLLIPCFVLGFFTILALQYWLAPITGFVWAACVMIYARLLGRIGWVISTEDVAIGRRPRKRRRRRKAADS